MALPRWIEAQTADPAGVWSAKALGTLHRGGLPGSVGTEHPENLALFNLERDIIDGDYAAVDLMKVIDLDDGDCAHLLLLDSQKAGIDDYDSPPPSGRKAAPLAPGGDEG